MVKIDSSWLEVLRPQFEAPYFAELKQFLIAERQQYTCYPKGGDIFAAFDASEQVVHPDIDGMEQILVREDLSVLPIHPGNVLEQVSCQGRPEIGQAAGFLVRNGVVCAQMSGSGSAVFGVFENTRAADAAAASAKERWEKVFVCTTCEETLQIHV